MKSVCTIVLFVCASLALAVVPAHATVDLTLFNSFPLLDSNGTTPLEGIAAYGDLVQLILVGPNGVIDTPTGVGAPGGDDSLLFTTHVNAGTTQTNTGFLVQSSILYADSLAGTGAYVRFWNSNTTANATFFGNSTLTNLPSGDELGLAELDFVPLSGSSRTADQPFSFSGGAAVPEPSQLFLLGLIVMGGWLYRKRRKAGSIIALTVALLIPGREAAAQLAAPFDVTATAPVLSSDGSVLPGSNPNAATFGFTQVPGCLVQILKVGDGGVAHPPDTNGNPTGNDTVIATTVIGQGIAPNVEQSGQFSTSFYPPPTQGSKVYARVFNAPTVDGATHWGQSATFTVNNVDVFDVSALGLSATTQPKGSDPTVTDTDGDGQTDYKELIANTNPLNASDVLGVGKVVQSAPGQPVNVSAAGRSGRKYTLQRSTDDLNGPMTWTDISFTGVLNTDGNVALSDPSPPNTPKAFYRIKVTMP